MTTEYIELRSPMARWLKANAESRGLTLQELVAHILSSYQEEWEDLEENTEERRMERTGEMKRLSREPDNSGPSEAKAGNYEPGLLFSLGISVERISSDPGRFLELEKHIPALTSSNSHSDALSLLSGFAFGAPVTNSHMVVGDYFQARHLVNLNSTSLPSRWSGQRQVKVALDKE